MRCQGEGTVHLNSKLDEVLTSLRQVITDQNVICKRLDVFAPNVSPSDDIVSFLCVVVMDPMGRKHQIPLDFCFSYDVCGLYWFHRRNWTFLFQKLLTCIEICLSRPGYPTTYAKFLMKCIKAGRFDLCIDTGSGVKELTSEDSGWEAGTTIVITGSNDRCYD